MHKYRIVNWDSFQHYKDRNPPWIKLHFEMLSSRTWVSLDDASRALAIACMLIASRNDGLIPSDDSYMQRVAYLNKKPNYKPLLDNGFLEPLADASTMLALARPETETEAYREETEAEVERVAKKRATRLPSNWELSNEMGEWAQGLGMSIDEILLEEEKFRDYWTGRAGASAAKLDWDATWRNWIRKKLEGFKK